MAVHLRLFELVDVATFGEHMSQGTGEGEKQSEADDAFEWERLCKRTGEVINEIRKDILNGYGFVPVIGSGMSASAGIPAGDDYRTYLFDCLDRVFTDDVERKWDPSSLKWPLFADCRSYADPANAVLEWTNSEHATLREESKADSKSVSDRSKAGSVAQAQQAARWQAIGAVADWRQTLHLLSRLKVESGRVLLKDPDNRVVDSFFLNLTEGRRPSTPHMLLAHLADTLRVKVILTTNFDSLIESAFRQLDMPVAMYDVHYHAGLPDPRFVRAQRSIVKLNGGRYGLRADFTLDQIPGSDDVRNFLGYLAQPIVSGPVEEANIDSVKARTRNRLKRQCNLLVMGVSGQERRTIALLCHAMAKINKLRVYWVCHRDDDKKRIAKEFRRTLRELSACNVSNLGKLVITSAPDLGHLLLALYERIFLSLPPAGVPFSAIPALPPPPYENLRRQDASSDSHLQDCQTAQQLLIAVKKLRERIEKLPGLILVSGRSGVQSAAAQCFYELVGRRHCVWLDLRKGCEEPSEFLPELFDALAREVGLSDTLSPKFGAQWNALNKGATQVLAKHRTRLASHSKKPIVLFINARDSNWSDDAKGSAINFLQTAILPPSEIADTKNNALPCITVVFLLPRTFVASGTGYSDLLVLDDVFPAYDNENAPPAGIVLNRINISKDHSFEHFLGCLSLFRYPCYRSALNSWALVVRPASAKRFANAKHDDEDIYRNDMVDGWLRELRKAMAIRDDDGQLVYIHPGVREKLLEHLKIPFSLSDRADAHQGIADWYVKLYRASGDLEAAFESIHHRMECIRSSMDVIDDLGSLDELQKDARYLVCEAIAELSVTHWLIEPKLDFASNRVVLRGSARVVYEDLMNLLPLAAKHLDGKCPKYLSDMVGRIQQRIAEAVSSNRADESPVVDCDGRDFTIDWIHSFGAREPFHFAREQRNRREYERAVGTARKALGSCGVETSFFDDVGMDVDPQLVRRVARECATAAGKTKENLVRAICSCGCWLSVLLHQSELHARIVRIEKRSDVDYSASAVFSGDAAKLLRKAERLQIFVTELLRFLDDGALVYRESATLRANTGWMLSQLGRTYETNRRFSEAYGYVYFSHEREKSLRFARVDAARAAAFLDEVERLAGDSDRKLGVLYDAIGSVERARFKAAGQVGDHPWYAWVHELELAVCVAIASIGARIENRFARCRDRGGVGEWFLDSLTLGLSVVADDRYRLARYFDMTNEFVGRTKGTDCEDDSAHLVVGGECLHRIENLRVLTKLRLEELPSGEDELVDTYVMAVLGQPIRTRTSIPPCLSQIRPQPHQRGVLGACCANELEELRTNVANE